jgi:hypothetical protein
VAPRFVRLVGNPFSGRRELRQIFVRGRHYNSKRLFCPTQRQRPKIVSIFRILAALLLEVPPARRQMLAVRTPIAVVRFIELEVRARERLTRSTIILVEATSWASPVGVASTSTMIPASASTR